MVNGSWLKAHASRLMANKRIGAGSQGPTRSFLILLYPDGNYQPKSQGQLYMLPTRSPASAFELAARARPSSLGRPALAARARSASPKFAPTPGLAEALGLQPDRNGWLS